MPGRARRTRNQPTAASALSSPPMRRLVFTVPDPRTKSFAAETARQRDTLQGAPEEAEALDFIEAVLSDCDE